MKAEDLKSSLLQYAVQGKLVPQDPNDEPASVLLERIREEKQRLIKEGKIKKDKNESKIYRKNGKWFELIGKEEKEIEVPFEIPNSWEFVKLGMLCDLSNNVTIFSEMIPDNAYVIELENIEKETGRIIGTTDPRTLTKGSSQHVFKKGTILYSKLRPYLNKVVIPTKDGYCSTELLSLEFSQELNIRYLQIALMSPYFVNCAMDKVYGAKMPRFSPKDGNNVLIPIPPIGEQKRIVDKLEELLPLIDKYNQNEIKLSELNSSLAPSLRKSILQYAIQGKLVPQDPNDEPASVLLERIREEKQRLIKEGKNKKDKNESRIYRKDGKWFKLVGKEEKEIEIPFEIPNTWGLARLIDIYDFIDYRGFTPTKISSGVRLITASNIKKGLFDNEPQSFISNEEYYSRLQRGQTCEGDLLFTTEAPLGNTCINPLKECSCGQRIITLQKYSDEINNEFFNYILQSKIYQDYISSKKTGTTVAGIKSAVFKEMYLPIPPINEQKRIISKIDEYMKIISALGSINK